jgi:hypothetical protein
MNLVPLQVRERVLFARFPNYKIKLVSVIFSTEKEDSSNRYLPVDRWPRLRRG